MILSIAPIKYTRRDKRRWHKRFIVLRRITVGGDGTTEPPRTLFVLFARLWARRSQTKRRWLYAQYRPAKTTQTHTFICAKCRTEWLSKSKDTPQHWNAAPCGALICADCVRTEQFMVAKPLELGSSNVYAVARPAAGLVDLYFNEGIVSFEHAESESIVEALATANEVLRGQHPAQTGHTATGNRA
jgi:hypothetical protein